MRANPVILAAAYHRIRNRSLLGADVISENGKLPEREKKRKRYSLGLLAQSIIECVTNYCTERFLLEIQ